MTNFGKTVRKRLIDLDKTQDWLAAQVRGTADRLPERQNRATQSRS